MHNYKNIKNETNNNYKKKHNYDVQVWTLIPVSALSNDMDGGFWGLPICSWPLTHPLYPEEYESCDKCDEFGSPPEKHTKNSIIVSPSQSINYVQVTKLVYTILIISIYVSYTVNLL